MKTSRIIIALVLIIAIYVSSKLRLYQSDNEIKNYEIMGVINKVTRGEKGIPTIIVNGKSYYIFAGWTLNTNLKIGDSIIKKKGDYKFIIYDKENAQYKTYDDSEYRY